MGHPTLCHGEDDELRAPSATRQHGCIETFLSGPGMAARPRTVTGHRFQPATIARRAADAMAGCEATLQRYEERHGPALAHVINILDPDVIVLGGGMSNITAASIGMSEKSGEGYVFQRCC